MPRPAAPTRASAERRLAWLVALIASIGCAGHERTASFAMRQEISFGAITVAVNGWEEVGQAHAPLSTLEAPAGEKAIAVFVHWSGLEAYAEADRQAFAKTFLRGRLRLVDADGFDYACLTAMPRELYHFSGFAAAAPRDWVAVFHAWVDSRGYTLRMTHPEPREEQFDVAIVPLG